MEIYRNGKAIELTDKEVCQLYLELQRKECADEVTLKLMEDYDIDPIKENINVMRIVTDIMDEVADNDTIWDCEQETYNRVIEGYLKERGLK